MNLKLFYRISLVLWTLGLFVHITSLFEINLIDRFPIIWLLHIGIFVVLFPAIFHLKNKSMLDKNPSRFYLFSELKKSSKWLLGVSIVCFFYAIINFMLFMTSQIGSPSIKDGQYILENHGTFIKTLTEAEYNHFQANIVRGFSGHWLLFYSFVATLLYPSIKEK